MLNPLGRVRGTNPLLPGLRRQLGASARGMDQAYDRLAGFDSGIVAQDVGAENVAARPQALPIQILPPESVKHLAMIPAWVFRPLANHHLFRVGQRVLRPVACQRKCRKFIQRLSAGRVFRPCLKVEIRLGRVVICHLRKRHVQLEPLGCVAFWVQQELLGRVNSLGIAPADIFLC